MATKRVVALTIILVTSFAFSAAARGWDCHYESTWQADAQFVTHFIRQGPVLVEPHWPQSVRYHILVDDPDTLIAVHAYVEPRSYGHNARGGAVVFILNKATGRMRRSLGASGETWDRVDFGLCERA